MVADQSAISRRSVGERSATDWRSVGDWLATVSWAFVFDCRTSATFFRSVGNRSATGRRLKTVSGLSTTAATGRRSVANQSATTNNLSTINLVAERFYLQQPKPPCDQIVPATICNRSATSRQPPCNHPATSLRPPEILVARSLTGCKLCVTGALVTMITPQTFDSSSQKVAITGTISYYLHRRPSQNLVRCSVLLTSILYGILIMSLNLLLGNDASPATISPRSDSVVVHTWVCGYSYP